MKVLTQIACILLVVVDWMIPLSLKFVSCYDNNDDAMKQRRTTEQHHGGNEQHQKQRLFDHRKEQRARQARHNRHRRTTSYQPYLPISITGDVIGDTNRQSGPKILTVKQQEEFMVQHGTVTPIETRAVQDIVGVSSASVEADESNGNVRSKNNRIRLYRDIEQRSIKFIRRGSYPGLNFSGLNPPDTNGDVGTTQYVQMVNNKGGSRVLIINKNTGTVQANFVLATLAPDNDSVCGSGDGFDPIVMYDQYANRWILTEVGTYTNTVCFYISQSSDALGKYLLYEFVSPTDFVDYLKFGVWRDAYYFGSYEGDPALYALERNAILAGKPAKIIRNYGTVRPLDGFDFQMLPPVDADGPLLPADDLPNGLFVRHVDDELHYPSSKADPKNDFIEIWAMKVNFTTSKSQVVLVQKVKIPEFSSDYCTDPDLFRSCVPQPRGTPMKLDALRQVVMNKPQYRNYYHYDTIVLSWSVGIKDNSRIGVHWIELRREAGTTEWTVYQTQQYSPNSVFRWMSSVAKNGCGDIAIGFSVSDAVSVLPGIRAVGRLVSDPLGTVTSREQTLITGKGVQEVSDRWGDYSLMTVDPVDDKTFWFTSEYMTQTGYWNTRIFKFQLDNSSNTYCTLTCLGGWIMNKRSSQLIVSPCREQCVRRSQVTTKLEQGWKVGRCL